MTAEACCLDSLLPVPQHIALIMDGNGRWACQRGLTREHGHRAATRNLLELAELCIELHIAYLTMYTFSTENWNRPEREVQGMFDVISNFLDTEVEALHRLGIRLQHIGRLQQVDEELQQKARRALNLTCQNTRLTLTVAFNYGGRADIVDAVRKMIEHGLPSGLVDERVLRAHLSTRDLPDPDLVIRTSGEQRLSNFLLWETAHSVCWTSRVYWPEFCASHLRQAIEHYRARRSCSDCS
jgi:undecaprenyl diphosphate synthase